MPKQQQTRENQRKAAPWILGLVLSAVGLLLAAALLGLFYQRVAVSRERRLYRMPGILIDVGGYRMHINCTGRGSPAVVLDSGLGDSFNSWRKVQAPISAFTQVCSYDRAGLGYSDSSPLPRTSNVIAEELQRLLVKSRVPPPYVLVGHSFGGFNVRLYASQNPSSVVGMVLVDSAHPDQLNRFPPAVKKMWDDQIRGAEFFELEIPFGIPRLRQICGSGPLEVALNCTFHSARAWVAEFKAFRENGMQTRATGPFVDLPLAVLSHDPEKLLPELPADAGKVFNKLWEEMQEELTHLSTHGVQKIAKDSSHYIQLDRPDLVIEGVRNVVDEARRSSSSNKDDREH